MSEIRIVDVADADSFGLLPACADLSFDHRTCDYWEDADRGSKAHRPGWLGAPKEASGGRRPDPAVNPFAPPSKAAAPNPFAPPARSSSDNPLATPFADPFGGDDEPIENPFAPKRPSGPKIPADGPRKLGLLGRGLKVFGSYAKVLLADDRPAGYVQFGPLSAYPRALRLRELYPQLPEAPLPAVITCIATTAEARSKGYARRLVKDVCDDLARRGFSAVEAYPEAGALPDATSAASPGFWEAAGFVRAVADDRFPVYRVELG